MLFRDPLIEAPKHNNAMNNDKDCVEGKTTFEYVQIILGIRMIVPNAGEHCA